MLLGKSIELINPTLDDWIHVKEIWEDENESNVIELNDDSSFEDDDKYEDDYGTAERQNIQKYHTIVKNNNPKWVLHKPMQGLVLLLL